MLQQFLKKKKILGWKGGIALGFTENTVHWEGKGERRQGR